MIAVSRRERRDRLLLHGDRVVPPAGLGVRRGERVRGRRPSRELVRLLRPLYGLAAVAQRVLGRGGEPPGQRVHRGSVTALGRLPQPLEALTPVLRPAGHRRTVVPQGLTVTECGLAAPRRD